MPSVLIIGASRGIGREFVNQYLADGWTVHATARSDKDIEALTAAGASAYAADTGDEDSLAKLAKAVPGDLDLLIVNAGVNVDGYEPDMGDVDAADWQRVMTINALGPVLAVRQLREHLQRPGGTIGILSSTLGSIGDNEGGGIWTYRMSKAALNAAIRNMQLAMKDQGIGVVSLHPGWVKTDMGGAQAPLGVTESVNGLRRVLAEVRADDDRPFVDYQGKTLPW
ncbi:MAG: SDR family NAD(P)-dependent oxidoreductase [Pseudomonadota bacterium]